MNLSHNSRGFGIIEIIVAMGIMVIIATSGVASIVQTFSANRLGAEYTEATAIAKEGLEASRSIRNQNWTSLGAGAHGITAGSSWSFSGSSNTLGAFTRTVTVSAAARNGSDQIVASGGTPDSDIYRIDSQVSWNASPTRSNTITLTTYLTQFMKAIVTGIGNWASPLLAGSLNLSGNNDGTKIQVDGDYAYIVRNGGASFSVVSITDPTTPSQTGSLSLSGTPNNIAFTSPYAYIASQNNSQEVQVVTVAAPAAPVVAGSYNAPGNADATGIYVNGNYLYVTRAESTDNEFLIVDITSPATPTLTASLNLGTGSNPEVVVLGNYAYVVSGNDTQELRVINISNKTSPTLLTTLDLSGVDDALTIEGFDNTIVVGRSNGSVHVISVATPSAPAVVGTYTAAGAVNDLSLGNDNKYVFMGTSANSSEFEVIDISTPASPTQVGFFNLTPNNQLLGIAYHASKDRAFAVGDQNGSEVVVMAPQ